MKIQYYAKGISPLSHARIEHLTQAWVTQHLEPLLRGFGYTESQLVLAVEKHPHGAAKYLVRLKLHLPPKKILVAKDEVRDLESALDKALTRMLREVQRHIDHIRKRDVYRRKDRVERMQALEAALASVTPAKEVEAMIEAVLPRLREAAHRELEFLRATGDLSTDSPTLKEVLDEIVATVKAYWGDYREGNIYHHLLHLMHGILEREVWEIRKEENKESLEQLPIPDTEEQARWRVEEDIHEFYQLDQAVRLEDLIMNEVATSFEETAEMAYMVQFLKELPISWRRALFFQEIELVEGHDLAKLLGVELAEVNQWIAYANHYLLARLEDAGFVPENGQPLFDWRKQR